MAPAALDETSPRPIHSIPRSIHPVHAVLLAGAVPLFLGVLLSDLAYSATYQVQWKNFASWLIVGGLVFVGLALLWPLIELIRAERRERRQIIYFIVLLLAWIVGFINALVHAKDVWESMPEALILSLIAAALVIAATWLGFSTLRTGGTE